jgi:CheY-like chemotaxis protein
MPRGGRITVATANVGREEATGDELPGTIAGEGAVSLTVADTGPGIDSEVLPHIFEPFFTTKKNDRGTGLGLSTVYGIVKQHGGNVRVRQTSPAGTTFEVIFPAAGEAVPVPVQESGEEPRLTGGETILLVEDEDNIRDYLATVLREHGYRVQAAADAMEAMSIFTACRHEIDLLVTDVIMPKMSGRELRDRLRADRPGLKYIFISGYTDEIIAQHDMDREGAHLLQKPFGPREFLLKIRQILEASA